MGYWALVNVEAAKRTISLNKQAGVANATKVRYAKTISKALELMKSRKGKMPSVLGPRGFNSKYAATVTL